MVEEKKFTERECHRKSAVDCFKLVWTLMDKKDRTKEEDDKMVHAAHASRFHWGEVGKPLEFERGEWQISRVYTVVNRPESALYHAMRCLEICREKQHRRLGHRFCLRSNGQSLRSCRAKNRVQRIH